MNAALEVEGLRKSFGSTVALDGIDLRVRAGTVFALLGPNGAGKTTTVHVLSTLIDADEGEARVAGHDVAREPGAVRAAIGVTGQFSAVDGLLTGEENLRLMADLCHLSRDEGQRRVAELLARFDLADVAGKPAVTYSGGTRRRLDLAMTLVGDPRIIFLDEPTTGLDPRSRRDVWRIVQELVDGGTTIFLTTHYLEEADRLADRVAVMDRGRVIAEGTPDELKRRIPGGSIRVGFADRPSLSAASALFPASVANEEALTLQIPGDGLAASVHDVLDRLRTGSIDAERVTVHEPDLDEVFLALTSDAREREGGVSIEHLRDPGLRHDAAPELPAHGAISLGLAARDRDPGDPAAAVRVRVRRHARRRPRRGSSGRDAYVDYVTPAIVLIAIAGAAQGTAISAAMDMHEGIIARFRTMGIARASVLVGHVLGSTVQTMGGLVIVIGIAVLVGFRPDANGIEWVAAGGLLLMITLAITWLSVALGLAPKSVEAASNLPMPLILLPFLSAGFVPLASMPAGLRWFAEWQPFTPFIETLRGLLMGTAIGRNAALSVVWCVVIGLIGYVWSMKLYERGPAD